MPFGITAVLGLDGRGFQAGMKQAQKTTDKWAASLKGQIAGAFTMAAVVRATKDVIEYGSKVEDLSKKLNISRRAVQEWSYAAELAGASIDDVGAAFKALSMARSDALKDTKSEKMGIFGLLGISKQDLKDNPLEEIMKSVSRAFQTKDFGAGEGDMVTAILGKGGMAMLPLMKEGIDQAADALKRMGGILNDDVIKNLDSMGDKLTELTYKFRTDMGDAVVWFVKKFTSAWQIASDFTQKYVDMIYADISPELGPRDQVRKAFEVMEHTKKVEEKQRLSEAAAKAEAPREVMKPYQPPSDAKMSKSDLKPASDSLAAIGGFVGGAGGVNGKLLSIEKELQKVNAALKGGIVLKE